MCARVWFRSALAVGLVAPVLAAGVASAPPGRERAVGTVTSTTRVAYRIVQGERELGRESVVQRVYDNNTIVFEAENTVSFSPDIGMTEKASLVIEEESRFPRSLSLQKEIRQPDGSFGHTIDVAFFANVAVVKSRLREAGDTRRVVVPAGTAVQDIGALFYWHQIIFWYDRNAGGRQRYQWLDPSAVKLETGEIYMAGDETLDILGKKTPVAVFKVEREKLGPATLYVDAAGTIVRGEQNLSVFELVEYSQQ